MPRVVTSVGVDLELHARATRRARELGTSFGDVVHRALKAYLGVESTIAEDADAEVRRLVEERDAKILGDVASKVDAENMTREAALADLQKFWHLYVSTGPKPRESKVAWVGARKLRYDILRTADNEALLGELEGG